MSDLYDLRYRQRYCGFLANNAIVFTNVNNMGVTLCHINIEKPKREKNIAKGHVRLRLLNIPIDYSPTYHYTRIYHYALSHRVHCETS